MKTVSQYQEDIKALMKSVGDMQAKAAGESRDLSTNEVKIQNEILDTVEEYKNIVGTMLRRERLDTELNAPANAPLSQPRPESPEERKEERKQDRFWSQSEFFQAVVRAGMPDRIIDPRLHSMQRAATGLGETVPSDGGFAVPPEYGAPILEDLFATSLLPSRCTSVTMSRTTLRIPGYDETSRASSLYGGVAVYWLDEAAQKTGSKPKFRQIELSAKKVAGIVYLTDELLEDAPAMDGYVRGAFTNALGFELDKVIYRGSGSGQPLGILNAGSLVTVSKDGGQAPDTVSSDNIFNMWARMLPGSLSDAVWLIHQSVWPQIFKLNLAVGTGGVPLFIPAGGVNQGPAGTLLGRPIVPIEQCSALGDLGDIMFASFKGYLLAQKGGIRSDVSIHLRFDYDETCLRFVLRCDGQPFLAQAITPYKGSDTLSHFVALEAR